MTENTDKPVTLISGASRGIGRYLADHYLAKGHQVVGCSRKPVDSPKEGYEHVCADITNEAEVVKMVAAIRQKFGRLDHLINNAGIAAVGHFLLTPSETMLQLYKTNVMGTMLLSRESAKLMKKRSYGRIVNFSSVAEPLRLPGESVYASSKAAVVSLTRILAQELGPFGITVNVVGPTPVPTDLIDAMPEEKVQAIIDRQPIPRPGTLQDIANVTDFFLSPESGFVSGQVVYLGGFA